MGVTEDTFAPVETTTKDPWSTYRDMEASHTNLKTNMRGMMQ
jgi:hypothetical protein